MTTNTLLVALIISTTLTYIIINSVQRYWRIENENYKKEFEELIMSLPKRYRPNKSLFKRLLDN